MNFIGAFILLVVLVGLVELVLNVLFDKKSSDREFALWLLDPKNLLKGSWLIWVNIGLVVWFFSYSCSSHD
jgi:hypothetical protein